MTTVVAAPGPAAPTGTRGLMPTGHRDVRLDQSGWHGRWQQVNRARTIPHVLARVESGEARANIARLIGKADGPHRGMPFTDSDVYKTLEAIAWDAGREPGGPASEALARAADLVTLLAAARDNDGYLNSNVQGSAEIERWADPQWGHELYCAGHLFQAAVAAARCSVLPELVEIARDFAELLVAERGRGNEFVDGHPEVETALVELYRLTGSPEYLELARHQLDLRGQGRLGPDRFGSSYFLDHTPVGQARQATGHAVRQLYLLTGMVDVAVEAADHALLETALAVWEDLYSTKTYITGAHGSRHRDEAIGDAYELPPDRAYAETCAAIASFQLNWRLLLATGQARFADAMELALFNAIAVSTATTGDAFFYSNPLQVRAGHDGSHEDAPSGRLAWYTCACCPPNIARLVASLHDYLVTSADSGVQVHHPFDGVADLTVGGTPVQLKVGGGYPASGEITVEVQATAGEWELALRVPAWCESWTATVDDAAVPAESLRDGYLRLRRDWTGRHRVLLQLAMPVRVVRPHHRVDAVRGCVALARGPVVYAVESVDLRAALPPGGAPADVDDLRLLAIGQPALVDDPPVEVPAIPITVTVDDPQAPLYATELASSAAIQLHTVAVPYHRWGNRGHGAMRVWLPTDSEDTL